MSKYTDKQLKEFALEFLYNDGGGDRRCDILLMMLSQHFRVDPQLIREKIRELAKHDERN